VGKITFISLPVANTIYFPTNQHTHTPRCATTTPNIRRLQFRWLRQQVFVAYTPGWTDCLLEYSSNQWNCNKVVAGWYICNSLQIANGHC